MCFIDQLIKKNMLNNIRKFSKTFLAKIILVIIIIPFVFWGMGGVFNSGNTNSLAKINNVNVSTQEFIEYLNESKINQEVIRDNLNNNILEQLLSQLISMKILEMEIKDLGIKISENSLASNIKNNESFQDDNKKFSRVKYEKFLLANNMTASNFENALKKTLSQQQLFNYIGAGLNSPMFFTNNQFKKDTKNIDIEYINLEKLYKNRDSFTKIEIDNYIEKNKDNLIKDYIDFSYSKITPTNLINSNEYNNNFFDKIDEIDNKLSNGLSFDEIVNEYNLTKISKKNFIPKKNDQSAEGIIYKLRKKSSTNLSDQNEYYLLYEIDAINKSLPDTTNLDFINNVKDGLYNKKKYDFNKDLLSQINDGNFDYLKFKNLVNNDIEKIKKVTIKSINDDKIFTLDTINIIYSVPVDSYLLGSDNNNNVFVIKVITERSSDISETDENFENFKKKSQNDVKNKILTSFDSYLNSKYEIKINEKTLERMRNYFK